MKKLVLASLAALALVATTAYAAELHPLSPQDAARAQQLLSAFDPNSYEFLYKHTDAKGRVQSGKLGSAVGLANLRQEGTVKLQPGGAASTVNTINIFKNASSVNTINIFKVAAPGGAESARASSVNTINIFKNAMEKQNAQELNALLTKYYH
jgi:hypothetical protein